MSEEFESLRKWKVNLAESTYKKHLEFFNYFFKWLQDEKTKFSRYTPDQLVEYQKKASGDESYEILDLLQEFVQGKKGAYKNEARYYSSVKSFFLCNRAPLRVRTRNISVA